MGNKTGIAWTTSTWNPLRGCSKVSPGCKHCYAEGVASRFCGVDKNGKKLPYHGLIDNGRWNGEVRMIAEKLDQPLRWKRPRKIFVNSMSDLFHVNVSNQEVAALFGVMAASPQHTFQVLTKRVARMRQWFAWIESMSAHSGAVDDCLRNAREMLRRHGLRDRRELLVDPQSITWPLQNVWLGVSAEDQDAANERVPLLLQCPAAIRWVSIEPQIGPVMLDALRQAKSGADGGMPYHAFNALTGFRDEKPCAKLEWVVVGGESGPGARKFNINWARSLVRQCRGSRVPVFVKQMGSNPQGVALSHRAGADPDEWPEDLRVREYPR